MLASNQQVSNALDNLFNREQGLYGRLEDMPLAWQTGHRRRMELLAKLDIGDVSDKVCLDFGSGSWGFACLYPRLHSCRYAYGMDISHKAIEMSVELTRRGNYAFGQNFRFLQPQGQELPLPSESVDLVFAGEAIEHIRFPQRFLRECHRVLKPGGQLVLTTPNRDALLYRTQDTRYGTSLEHFWLLNWAELNDAVSEFFDIEEALGFNGSIFQDMDKAIDEAATEEWSRQFEARPDLASGIILRARRKASAPGRDYRIDWIPESRIAIAGAMQILDLAIGLKVKMIDQPSASISFDCPPADGLAIFMCTHAWSGYATINVGSESRNVNLYSKDQGWLPLVFRNVKNGARAEIRATGKKAEPALAAQVIFSDTFSYSI